MSNINQLSNFSEVILYATFSSYNYVSKLQQTLNLHFAIIVHIFCFIYCNAWHFDTGITDAASKSSENHMWLVLIPSEFQKIS